MPGYIQNPYMPQYGGFQYGNYPVQPNAPYQTPATYPTFNPQPQTISNSADALAKSDISGKIVESENRQGQAQIHYDMATNTCAIQNAIQNQTQQIIQNDNANYRQLHDEIVANRMEDLKSKIADQAQEINQLNLSASQCQQNAYLISQLRPNPVPAFQVANPFASMYTGCCNNNVAI